ncbi:uncharacterized protein C8R40DRAFT_1131609 [Lentinula edodes]|uniref:uncharacterized protein n=1 Tax=Lentinula edodes TaxID=5353 RepID=UPI001E8EB872|nr:uncharacterized protein C8R40DRAFT_1131609 [Lentinula edodes]KAH7869175.1 hypothetical protein C8R40DRAFT_1131609 [Lentinula edodes]
MFSKIKSRKRSLASSAFFNLIFLSVMNVVLLGPIAGLQQGYSVSFSVCGILTFSVIMSSQTTNSSTAAIQSRAISKKSVNIRFIDPTTGKASSCIKIHNRTPSSPNLAPYRICREL